MNKLVAWMVVPVLAGLWTGCSSLKIENGTALHPDGTVAARYSYYFDAEGHPVFHGNVEKFYENGVRASSKKYVHGKVEGRATFYLRTQELMYVTFHRNVANGPVEVCYPEGKLKWRGQCRDGQFDGPFTFWDQNGRVMAQGTFHKGAPHDGTFVMHNQVRTYDRGRLVSTRPLGDHSQKSQTDGMALPQEEDTFITPR